MALNVVLVNDVASGFFGHDFRYILSNLDIF